MNMRSIAPYVGSCVLGALVASSAWSHDDDRTRAGELIRQVREATARFRDAAVAEAEGYHH